jgi:hypothetical protein
VSGAEDADRVHEGVLEVVRREARAFDVENDKGLAPIIEINLRGHLGFKNSLLDIARLRAEVREATGALHVIVTNRSVPVEYAVAEGLDTEASRMARERRIIEDLIARDTRFRDRAPQMAGLILEAKRLALSDETPEKILELIEQHLDADAVAESAADQPELVATASAMQALERNAGTP